MSNSLRRPSIACSPRPWLTREPGECAFPTGGEGKATRACCNPCEAATYCAGHRALMRGPPAPSVADMERELARFIGQSR